jgi:O-antigen/teichoic acid export membrane protein
MVMLRLRSEQRKLAFSFLHFITTLSSVGLGYIAVKYFGFKGAIWALISVNLSAFIIVSAKFLPKVNYFYFDYKEIAYLVKIGFPVMLAGIAVSFFITMDKIFLIRFSTVENLGVYQIAILPMIFGIAVQSLINQVTTPKLLYDFGAGSSLSSLYKQALIISFFVMIIMIILGPFIVFILNFIIKGWLPLYSEALPLISIFYLTSILIAANLSDIIYVASNKPKLMFYQNLVLVLLAFMVFLFISSKSIIWYAYAVLILQLLKLLSSLLINFLIVRNSKYT